MLSVCYWTVKEFTKDLEQFQCISSDKGKSRKLTHWSVCHIKGEVIKKSILVNLKFLDVIAVSKCQNQKIFDPKSIGKHGKLISWPPLKGILKENWMKLATKYMKTNFSAILFNNKCHSIQNGRNHPHKFEHKKKHWNIVLGSRIIEMISPHEF